MLGTYFIMVKTPRMQKESWGFQQRGVFSEILKIILMSKRKLRKKIDGNV